MGGGLKIHDVIRAAVVPIGVSKQVHRSSNFGLTARSSNTFVVGSSLTFLQIYQS